MKQILINGLVAVVLFTLPSCNGQSKNINQPNSKPASPSPNIVGGGCDGCEIMYVGMPVEINSVDTSSAWNGKGQQLMVTGTVFQIDGKTPAPNVIIYYWQTDNDGYYSPKDGMDEKARMHGHIRGWVKTDTAGKYTIYTIRPSPYPNDVLPAHIHFSVKEPGIKNEYYTDDINFEDDKLLNPYLKKYPQEKRGGSGIVRILIKNDLQIAERDIVLGLNIPHYPQVVDK